MNYLRIFLHYFNILEHILELSKVVHKNYGLAHSNLTSIFYFWTVIFRNKVMLTPPANFCCCHKFLAAGCLLLLNACLLLISANCLLLLPANFCCWFIYGQFWMRMKLKISLRTIWRVFIDEENKKETINGHQAHCLFTDHITKNIISQFIF